MQAAEAEIREIHWTENLIAMVGLHNWYHTYPFAAAIEHVQNLDLIIASRDNPAQLKEFAAKFKVKETSTDLDVPIRRKDVEIMLLGAYTSSHLELVRTACEEGKHVLCFKPLKHPSAGLGRWQNMSRKAE